MEFEHENRSKENKIMKMVLKSIPRKLIEIAKCFNEEINATNQQMKYVKATDKTWRNINELTTKEMQIIFKIALKKVELLDVNKKLGIKDFNYENFLTLRKHCKNPKLRNIYFRLVHNDFFTGYRMKKFRMTDSDLCKRCGEQENAKHLMWECKESKQIWKLYNELMLKYKGKDAEVTTYDEIHKVENDGVMCLVKLKIIREMIQIERPKNWTAAKIHKITEDLMNIELYVSLGDKSISKFNLKWGRMKEILQSLNVGNDLHDA
jgi:hypothetical protein